MDQQDLLQEQQQSQIIYKSMLTVKIQEWDLINKITN